MRGSTVHMEGHSDDEECWYGLSRWYVVFEVLFSSSEPSNALLQACTR